MKRREFAKKAGMGLVALNAFPAFTAARISSDERNETSKVPLGLCEHSLRGMRLKAGQILEYAIGHNLDSVLYNSFASFESLDPDYLRRLKEMADAAKVTIYIGAGSISEKSTKFSNKYGSAESLLQEGIRVATALGSPIIGCRIGSFEDRYGEGGIGPRIDEVVRVMKANRSRALDAGIKFAFENHSGDLRSGELLDLIEETGTDVCGALYDPGNAILALEDPMKALVVLGELVLCTSVRDYMIWESEGGATFQWTAIGEGLMDYVHFANFMSEKCPGVPLHVETISNEQRPIPYLERDFWKGYPKLPASEMVDFLKLLRAGTPLEIDIPAAGVDKKAFDINHQESELTRSFDYLRKKCNTGLKI